MENQSYYIELLKTIYNRAIHYSSVMYGSKPDHIEIQEGTGNLIARYVISRPGREEDIIDYEIISIDDLFDVDFDKMILEKIREREEV